jgi:hypothetical protein
MLQVLKPKDYPEKPENEPLLVVLIRSTQLTTEYRVLATYWALLFDNQ